ncbi:histidyl-tRNA synthetase [Clostridium carboxidivorans P7]|uniref:Histidine--tRNA ligase n=1 Tax=Clostridium carboxidivorans P7 TaxID=536227 RepID=C6PXR3_9CLOT|nr:histidine--tRNA ligase [Clostridium carboxidivorans]AKN32468.1 histidyl-tRNA synthetase [Clostridium carboxidivorans P7]EET85990.1 histidyl-tRNA synthetase [Clostridium carboxidivorans P7]EFG87652.1 histidyl-tRNA synthetase [Clostridium carboxidivorans P7]
MNIQAPKGTKDMLPKDAYKWHYVENKFRELSEQYGIKEIRTPMFEHTELFTRGVGETTDVVQKEMYTFEDKGGRSITLKPEGTAPSVRAFIESSLYNEAQPTKLYYFIPAFRYENVQKGRLRQFHQYGVEIFGSQEASIDAEGISIAMRALDELGLKNLSLNINSLGCPDCRKKFNDALKSFLKENYDDLCPTCKSRFERNPMRILDCKEEKCKKIAKNAPTILDYICDDCKNHFEELKKYLDAIGIKYTIDPYIVRGLDYYTKTVFEIIYKDLTVCGGGRYDKLIEELGGPDMPAFGFAAGLERLIMTLESEGIEIPRSDYVDLYVGAMGDDAKIEAFKIVNALRAKGLKCDSDHMNRSVKASMKYANKTGARFTVVLGENELQAGTAKLKRMEDGQQFEVDLKDLDSIVKVVK